MKSKKFHNEIQLLDSLKKGEEWSYTYLFKNYYNRLCIYVIKMSDDEDLAKDVVQDVFVNLWKKKAVLKINSSLKNYLYKSTYHKFLEHLRREKRTLDLLEEIRWELLYEINIEEDEQSIFEDRMTKLLKIIEGLPPKCKRVFEMSRFEKLKYREIAKIMGISQKTVEIHISKALKILKNNFLMNIFF